MIKKELFSYFNDKLKPLGFRKKGSSWYKENPDTLVVYTLDKSRFGDVYYAEISIFFKELLTDSRPKFYKNNASLRAEGFGEQTREYLDLENDISNEERKKRIDILIEKSLPIIESFGSVAGFKELLTKYNPRIFAIDIESQKYLGIHID